MNFRRVFAMIVVRGGADSDWQKELDERTEDKKLSSGSGSGANSPTNDLKDFPFECYAFVCDSRQGRRQR
jgi:hypothetical protein